MDQFPSQVLTDSEIHTLVDGQASPEKLAALQLRLSLDPAGQATFQKWQRQCDALRGLHKPVLAAPVPKMLQLAAQQSFAAQQEINQWWRWSGMAATCCWHFTRYLGALAKSAVGTDMGETGFQFAADAAVPSFYWIDQGFGYALAGPVPRDVLMKLAEAVYRQL